MTVIAIDTATAQRMPHVLALVQVQVPAADEDYVWSGAVGVGLNRLFDATFEFVAGDFADPAVADDTVDVTLASSDAARASSLATELDVDEKLLLSAAICIGMGKLAGYTGRLIGPFVET